MNCKMLWAVVIAFSAFPGYVSAGERVKANIDCAATEQKLIYDCTIMLMGKKSGNPIEDAQVTVNADMPSMPMAHNIRPVTAMPTGMAGMYHAQIELEMFGQWALTLDVEGPARDRIIEKLQFGDVKAEAGQMGHEHGEMNHGSGGMSDGDDQMKHGDEGAMEGHSHDEMNEMKALE